MNNKFLFASIFLALFLFILPLINADSCYQESANVLNQTGIDGNCDLNYTGSYRFTGTFVPSSNIIDGNWNTYATGPVAPANVYVNYSIPKYYLNTSKWMGRSQYGYFSYSFDYNCLAQSNLQLRIEFVSNSPLLVRYECYNGASWSTIFQNTGTQAGNIYEEAMNWDIQYFDYGNGTIDSPYQINSWTQLNLIRRNLTANYLLMANLSSGDTDYSGIGNSWSPIGDEGETYPVSYAQAFWGNFYGNGNSISDLVINRPTDTYVGLFGFINGNISNLNLKNVSIIGGSGVGGITGSYENSTISNCSVTGNIFGVNYVGGLVGVSEGSIVNSYSIVEVNGTDNIGGIVGALSTTPKNPKIANSYSISNITGNQYIGGIAGASWSNITNCYSGSNVTGNLDTGGIVGKTLGSANISNSFYDNQTSGQNDTGKGVGKTISQMTNISTFTNWSIAYSQTNLNNNYPYLSWQNNLYYPIWSIFDSVIANLTISSPSNGTYNWNQTDINYLITDNNLDSCWYSSPASISFVSGYNLIGMSSDNNISINNVYFNGYNYTDAKARGIITSVNVTTNISSLISSEATVLQKGKGYFIVGKTIGNMTLKGIGGSLSNDNVKLADLIFINSTGSRLNITQAVNASWFNSNSEHNTVYYYNSEAKSYNTVQADSDDDICIFLEDSGETCYLKSWTGYAINSLYNNITVLRKNNQTIATLNEGWNSFALDYGPLILNNCSNLTNLNLYEGYNTITIYANDSVNQISSDSRTIFRDRTKPIGSIIPNDTFVSNTPVNFTLNASDVSGLVNATLFISNQTYDKKTIKLSRGLNYFGAVFNESNIGDNMNRTIALATGNNLIGISNRSDISLESVSYNDGTNTFNYTYARDYNYASVHNNVSYAFIRNNINFSNGTDIKNSTEAFALGWYGSGVSISNAIQYWYCDEIGSCGYSSVSGTSPMSSYTSYLINAKINGLSIIIPNTSIISLPYGNSFFSADTITTLQAQHAYWVSSYANVNMTLQNVGGDIVGDKFVWKNVRFSYDGVEKNITDAVSNSWITTIYWWDTSLPGSNKYTLVTNYNTLIPSYRGYFITSNVEGLKMIFDEQLTYVNQTTINSPSNGVISISIDLLHGIYQYFWSIFDTLGNFFITNTQSVGVDFQNITNCQELQNMQYNLTANYQLVNNIDCSDTKYWNNGAGFIKIGKWTKEFTGKIEGNNFNITNIYANNYSTAGNNDISVFGRLKNVEIKNVNVINANMSGIQSGILFSYAIDTSIINCHVTGNLRTNRSSGGLGIALISTYKNLTQIVNSSSIVTINSEQNSSYMSFGGLVAQAGCTPIGLGSGTGLNFSIIGSYSISNITSGNIDYSGGLIGSVDGRKCLANWSIKNSYAISTINGSSEVGGLIGYISNLIVHEATIENCYAISNLYYNGLHHYPDSGFGGLIGNYYGKNDTLNNSFAETIIYSNSSNNTGGLIGTHAHSFNKDMLIYNSYYKSTPNYNCYSDMNDSNCTQITDSMYFKDDVSPDQPFASWDFNNVWQEKANDYPVLLWEATGSNFDSMNITNCSTIVKPNRIYTVNNNITIPKLTSCFSINASNTTINLNGKTIGYAEYNYSNGISLNTQNIFNNIYAGNKASNFTIIKNGVIINSKTAITIPVGSYNWLVSNISFFNNRISILSGNINNGNNNDNYTDHIFQNNYIENSYISSISNTSWGIIPSGQSENDYTTNVTIRNNIINYTYIGIYLDYGGNKVNVINNTIINSYEGIALLSPALSATENYFDSNKIYNNTRGIIFLDGCNNTFLNNQIYGNSQYNAYFRVNLQRNFPGIFIYNNSYGQIVYPLNVTFAGTTIINRYIYNDLQLGNTINITNNSVIVIGNKNSSSFPNFTANITLNGLKTTYIRPVIKRDDIFVCNSSTSPSCTNFTSLNAGTVIFNVSSFSSYKIAEADILKINITSPISDYYPPGYNISVNYSITNYDTQTSLDSCWYNLLNYAGNYVIANTSLPNCLGTNISITNEGLYTLNIFANTTNYSNYIEQSSVNIGISKLAVQLNKPNDNQFFNSTNDINFSFTANSIIDIYSCELWGNWTGTFSKNKTFNSVTSGQINSVILNISEGNYYWNAICKDDFGINYQAFNNYNFGVDLTTPSPKLKNIATSTGSQTINVDVSSGDANPNICKYTITNLSGTIDGLNNNVSFPCDNIFSATVTTYGSFNISFYIEDKVGHSNFTNGLFTVSASPPSSPGGGGDNNNQPTIQIITQRISENLTFYPDVADITLSKGSTVPREKSINIINKNIQSAEVKLSCIENTEVETSGNICDYVKFENEKVIASGNQQYGTEVKFYVTTPQDASFGNNYAFIIVGTYVKPNNSTEFLKASVTASVPLYGILLKNSDIPGTSKTYPVAVLAGIIAMIIFILTLILLAKKYPISAFFISVILFLISFIVLLLWL